MPDWRQGTPLNAEQVQRLRSHCAYGAMGPLARGVGVSHPTVYKALAGGRLRGRSRKRIVRWLEERERR